MTDTNLASLTADMPLIMQFGTSRFLQAHVDYFVSHSLVNGYSAAPILVVQTSNNPAGKRRVKAMNQMASYPVRIQGLQEGKVIDQEESVQSIIGAMAAKQDWPKIVELFCEQVTHVISNTADDGYALDEHDHMMSAPPKSYPAKLLVLLLARYDAGGSGVTIMPCELVANNGSVLKELILSLAKSWSLAESFINWMQNECIWVNSLVDRIVSAPIEPIGAVAEPYALWAIERQKNLELPCQHPAIRLVDDLAPLEWLKLSLLNLSHTYLVDLWQQLPAEVRHHEVTTVMQAMQHDFLRTELEWVLTQEIVPILMAMELKEDIDAYLNNVRERFLNPFLEHQLADIANNHKTKVERRILPIVEKGQAILPEHHCPKLAACLTRNAYELGNREVLENSKKPEKHCGVRGSYE